jgi:hydrogenase maturation protein HypF
MLEEKGFKVLIHSLIPPNDGGISLGQAVYGMNKLMNGGI